MVKLAWEYNRSYVAQRSVLTSIAKLEQFVREIFDVRLYHLTFLGLGSIGGLAFSVLRLVNMAQDRTARGSQSFLFCLAAVWLAVGGALIAMPGGAEHLQYWMVCHVGLLICTSWLLTTLFPRSGVPDQTKTAVVGSVMLLLLLPNVAYVGSLLRDNDYSLPPNGFARLRAEADASPQPLPIFWWGWRPRLLIDLNLRQVSAPISLFLLRARYSPDARGNALYESAWHQTMIDVARTPPAFIIVSKSGAWLKEIDEFKRRFGSLLERYTLLDEGRNSQIYRLK
jgi:hypothetical protein